MVELRQNARFVDETAQADGKGLGQTVRLDRDGQPVKPRGERRRHVFLECDVASERLIVREIDDTETTDADQPGNLELADLGADRQGVALLVYGYCRCACGRRGSCLCRQDPGLVVVFF